MGIRSRKVTWECVVCFLLIAVTLTGLVHAQSAQAAARVWEAPLKIPTYELGLPDPNPPLFDRERTRGRPSYPYPLLDSLTDRRVDKTYRAVFLENEYLRVTVLPELGGKLYAIYDKSANRDVLYTNHVVKYAMVGIRGAWTSGGIEWNFPDGHTLTTVSPIDFRTRMEADGSAVVVVGDTERVQRMQWAVAIRLRPGRKFVETEVTLNNRREVPGRYWFWATAAARATDDMRFVYPMREAYPHAFWPVFSFPKEKGIDIATYREVTNYLSLFARDSRRDFFGIYYEKEDWGIAHVADRFELPGKKTWTWGTDEAGRIWIDKLTDSDGQYVEFQAGRFETQMEHEFIAPHRVERFTEYWFPLNRLGGGFNKVTKDVALRVEVIKDEVRIYANASAKFDDVRLVIGAAGKEIHTSSINLSPATPFATTVKLPSPMIIVVRIRDRDGRELVHYYTDSPADGNPDFKPATRPKTKDTGTVSAESAYITGVAADKKSNEPRARAAYSEALKLDPGYAPAHMALGLSYYRTGEYAQAAEHLEAALDRDRDAADAHYYLALVRRAQDRVGEAIEHLMWCVRAGHQESMARYLLGEIDLASDTVDHALKQLSESVALNPRDLKARAVLAVAERRTGRIEAALARIDQVLQEMPIDYLALHERYLLLKAHKREREAEQAWDELWRLLSREPDAVLELIFDYLELGRAEAHEIVRSAFNEIVNRQRKQPHPVLSYLLNSSSSQAETASAAFKTDPSLIFPHRNEEIALLQAVLKASPEDGRAAYYLGNALASKFRFSEALEAWRVAVKFDSKNAVAHRNYARALAMVEGKTNEAAKAFESAIELEPEDPHLYVEFDRLLASMKETQRRIKLLEGAPPKARSHTLLLQHLAAAYVDGGRFTDAIDLLKRHTFTSGEGEGAALAVYRKAHLALARKYQENGKHHEAAAALIGATEYPKNFGVARPAFGSQAREYVSAAREFEAAGDQSQAATWWQRAAEDPLNSPTQPDEPWSEHYYFKALALDHVGRKDEAVKLYERLARLADDEKMLATEPSPPQGAMRFVLAGWGLKALKRNEEAKRAFERAIQIDPSNAHAREEMPRLNR
jgi:tetratricopeptide (TPR) repeat protein